MQDFLASHWLDFLTTVLGLIYIWLEYRASIALWIVGVIMPALDIILYWSHGLYGDAGLAAYYTLAAFYGYMVWKFGKKRGQTDKQQLPITHFPLRLVVPVLAFFLAAWGLTYYVLITWTNSTVPVLDSFTNALSIVGLWTLARKYLEQWLFWMVVDLISCVLYVQKGIPFKALLYGLYVVIAVMGWFKWKKMMNNEQNIEQTTTAL
jgi:nicotinamide mononucleotide transporter